MLHDQRKGAVAFAQTKTVTIGMHSSASCTKNTSCKLSGQIPAPQSQPDVFVSHVLVR